MPGKDLTEKLVEYLEDAHVMEQNVLKMLETMISTTTDANVKRDLEHHHQETERHERTVRERLEAHGRSGAPLHKEMGTMAGTMVKGMVDKMRADKPAKNARDGFVTEHLEIATYELLERLASLAGDEATAEVARQNRHDEEEMAKKIALQWDRFLQLTLHDSGHLSRNRPLGAT
jgi:ferritin-like metal-binding protein YciE